MDKIKIASWNVRGLESTDRKYIVKRFLMMVKGIDIMLLQEVKAVGFLLDIALKCIWKDADAMATNHPKGRGGAAILVGPN
jgi:exonuclease III